MLHIHLDACYTPRQLAELLGKFRPSGKSYSLATLQAMRRKGSGPRFVKRGGAILYPIPEVEAWLSHVVGNTAQALLPQPTNAPTPGKARDSRSESRPAVAAVAAGNDAEVA